MANRNRYAEDLKRCRQFTVQEERRLYGQLRRGQKARQALIESMLPYIVRRAGEWLKKSREDIAWCSCDDLIQEANIALIDVVDNRFDPDKGRLITILEPYVGRAFQRARSRQSLVRVPDYFLDRPGKPGKPDRTYQRQADVARKLTTGSGMVNGLEDRRVGGEPNTAPGWSDLRERALVILDALESVSFRDRDIMRDRLHGVENVAIARKHGLCKSMITTIVRQVSGKLSCAVKAEREEEHGEPQEGGAD